MTVVTTQDVSSVGVEAALQISIVDPLTIVPGVAVNVIRIAAFAAIAREVAAPETCLFN